LIDDAPHRGALQDEVGSGQVRRSGDKCQHRSGERVRRIGHHPERTPWRGEDLEVALDDCGGVVNLVPEVASTSGVQLNRDHPSASLEKRHSESAGAGS
jgi:hypothetical protein